MVHFSHKVSAIPVILAALFVAGCYDHTYDYSDYEDHDSRRAIAYHDSSDIFTALSGNFSLEKPLVPKTLTITALDQKLISQVKADQVSCLELRSWIVDYS